LIYTSIPTKTITISKKITATNIKGSKNHNFLFFDLRTIKKFIINAIINIGIFSINRPSISILGSPVAYAFSTTKKTNKENTNTLYFFTSILNYLSPRATCKPNAAINCGFVVDCFVVA
jgi:hypothetical protein